MSDATPTSKSHFRPGTPAPDPRSPSGPKAERRLTELAHEELLELCSHLERWLDDERVPR